MRIIGDESHWLDNCLGTDGGPNAKYQTLKSLGIGIGRSGWDCWGGLLLIREQTQ